MIFVIDRRDAVLRYGNGCIELEQDGRHAMRVPINQLELVVVHGNPMAETAVWRALATAAVPTVLLSARGPLQSAVIGAGLATQLPLRCRQHRCALCGEKSLAMARWFAAGKIAGYSVPLALLDERFGADPKVCAEFTRQADDTVQKIAAAQEVAEIMGLEGYLAHAWFALLSRYLPAEWKFAGRNRRPPRDPVNALLSLGYTLLAAEIHQGVVGFGFDPSLGFLHQNTPGRESLVLDFTELFRAGVDDFVLRCLADEVFIPEQFYYRDEEGCRLAKIARPVFFQSWAYQRENWPRMAESAEAAVGSLREQIGGRLMAAREFLKTLEPGDGG